jgi:hypothetical protein
MIFKEDAEGSEYVIFPMDRTGFKISKHPHADPHLGDSGGFRHRLDLSAMRSMDWDEIAKEWEPWWNSLFYWPSHRADLLAIPGPVGKTWFEGLLQTFGQEEIDLVGLVRFVFGGGTIYKVRYGAREAFFETALGRSCVIIDPRERRFGSYIGGPYPGRPLLGFRWEEGMSFSRFLPGPLRSWTETIDVRIETSMEAYFDDVENQVEQALLEVLPELEAFFENFKVVRWKQEERA